MFQTTNQLWSSVHFLLWTWQYFPKKIFTKRNSSVRLRLWVCPSVFSPGIFRFRPGRRLTITSGPSNSKDYAWPWSNSYSNKISKNHWVFHLYKGCNMLQLNMQNSEWERNWPKMTRFIPVSGRCNLWAKVKLMDSIWGSTWVPHDEKSWRASNFQKLRPLPKMSSPRNVECLWLAPRTQVNSEAHFLSDIVALKLLASSEFLAESFFVGKHSDSTSLNVRKVPSGKLA